MKSQTPNPKQIPKRKKIRRTLGISSLEFLSNFVIPPSNFTLALPLGLFPGIAPAHQPGEHKEYREDENDCDDEYNLEHGPPQFGAAELFKSGDFEFRISNLIQNFVIRPSQFSLYFAKPLVLSQYTQSEVQGWRFSG